MSSIYNEGRDVLAERIQRVLDWLQDIGGPWHGGDCDTQGCDDGQRPGGHKGACLGVVEDILRGRA